MQSLENQLYELITKIAASNTGARDKTDWVSSEPVMKIGVGQSKWILERRDSQLWDLVVLGLQSTNKEMVSKVGAREWLIKLVYRIQDKNWGLTELEDDIRTFLAELRNFKTPAVSAWVPISGLDLSGKPIIVGDVVLEPLESFAGVKQKLTEIFKGAETSIHRIQCIAKTSACGDNARIEETAKLKTEYALNILRAFLGSFASLGLYEPVGSIGTWAKTEEIVFFGSTIDGLPPDEPCNTSVSMRGTWALVPSALDAYWRYYLEQCHFDLVQRILEKPQPNRTQMERKLLRGLYWLGEATLPDDLQSKLVKVEFALEAMIGGDVKDIPLDSIRARLAERAAFIIGGEPRVLKEVDTAVKKYIGMRNAIAHGDAVDVEPNEVEHFGALVLKVAIRLLEMVDNVVDRIKKIDDLQNWVLKKRYGL